MAIETLDTELMNERPELALLHWKLRTFGAQADAVANIPEGFFDGVELTSLNCNGFEYAGHAATTTTERCRMFELLGHADPSLAIALPGPSLTLSVLQNLASPKQQHSVLAIMQSKEPRWGAFALSEPHSGSDATHVTLSAQLVPGGFLLNGQKCYIGNAGRAHYAVVFATVDERKGQFGVRAFLLDLPRDGLSIDDTNRMLGLRAVRVSRLIFENCFVPDEMMLGHGTMRNLAKTFAFAQLSFDSVRPCLSSLIVGASFGLIDQLRKAEGTHRSLATAIDVLTERFAGPLQSGRLICRNAAGLVDAKNQSSIASSMCKLYVTAQACALVDQALMLPGIAGHRIFGTLTRLQRDFQSFRMMEGTSDVHSLMIARQRSVLHRKMEIARQHENGSEDREQKLVA